jgi:Asp-tRNA(Asn)/Glu-tRNA(Gln) amidotransferase A subunit family amidase
MIKMFRKGNPFQKPNERRKSLFVAAFLLAFTLVLYSVTLALPINAVAQQAPTYGTPAEAGPSTEDVPKAAEAAIDASKTMAGEGDNGEKKFEIVEATIGDIHDAIKTNEITCSDLVQQYIDRAKAYNGICTQLVTEDGEPVPAATGAVRAGSPLEFPTETVAASDIFPNFSNYTGQPMDFGRMEATASDPSVQQQFGMRVGIPDAGQVNALETLNIRGERSVTCKGEFDAHPSTGPLPAGAPEACEEFRQQPDALERAAELDEQYGSNPPLDELPMYCIPMAIKDPWDTKDMRSTSNGDADYAMDAAPEDSTIVAQLREKGAIIYAKAGAAEYHAGSGDPGGPATPPAPGFFGGSHSTWSGTTCNPYDTARQPGGSSSGSGAAVAANLAVCSICETTGGSCRNPGSNQALVSLVSTKGIMQFGGVSPAAEWRDRPGVLCRTLEDATLVLDAMKDPESGYFDPRDKHTGLPQALIPDEPYATFLTEDSSLEGMRIGIVREHLVKPTPNDVAISDQFSNEIKTVLRDQLGAELVESVDPLYPDDPDVPNMEYTFQDALAEILPLHMPEYFTKTTGSGELEFAVPGWNVTTREYMAAAAAGEAPLSDKLNLRRITSLPQDLSFSLTLTEYLLERGDERITNWTTLNDNSKFYSDLRRAAHDNWESKTTTQSPGITEGIKMRYVMTLLVNKVMLENDIDVLVNGRTTLPIAKILGPADPGIPSGRQGSITDIGGFPEITVPAGYNEIVYEPEFVLEDNNANYTTVAGTEQSTLPNPLPIGMMFWAGPGEEPALLKVASAYEAATHHRVAPAGFGPLSSFPIEHMSNTTASAGYGVYAQKPARAEYVTNSSELVGDNIDSIILRMKSVGTINGTAEIGILNEDLSVKKLFGTLDVTTLTPTYTDYEFKLTGGELYQIEEGDRIGIKYEGGGFNETSWVSVMLDLDPADPFDGANSYLQYHYQGSWQQSPDRDMHMVLVQTHG